MLPNMLLAHLSAGFNRFRNTWYTPEQNIYETLRMGQNPMAAVVSCSDSRVDPVQILDAKPGDLFVIRNVANLVPPHEPDTNHHGVSAALEFAVRHLRVRHVIVMGHARCGGYAKLLNGPENDCDNSTYLKVWMDQAMLAKTEVDRLLPTGSREDRQRECELWGIRISLINLQTFPWVRSAVDAGELYLHGFYFDMDTGDLLYLRPETDTFVSMRSSSHTPLATAS